MSRFLLEVPHEAVACARAAQVFLNAGSHFLTHADRGCTDGEHKAWIIAEVDSKDEARAIIPSQVRAHARIVRLTTFSLKDFDRIREKHSG